MARIGIDIGALFLKAVVMDSHGNVQQSFYKRHLGEPGRVLNEILQKISISKEDFMGITGANGETFAKALGITYRDTTLCQLEAIRRLAPDTFYIMDVGGGSATLIQLDGKGNFQGYSTNSLCAAGTGSFLDEQAGRLGISYEEANQFVHNENPPTIATRCTVFAKSDLIHRQQEGYSRNDMWSGLCRGMTRTLLSTLLNGRPLDGKTLVLGGVAQNQEVMCWLQNAYPGFIQKIENPHLVTAMGAAWEGKKVTQKIQLPLTTEISNEKEIPRFPWRLVLEKSTYPNFETQEAYEDTDQNEVRVTQLPDSKTVSGYMGIDIGSTSTKLILMDEKGNVWVDIYRKTSGDPIGATKLIFRALRTLMKNHNKELRILGVGTTGSGRKIVGTVIGADAIINEISAHVAGAVRTDPSVDTIFEIGGQDAKYMHLRDGHIQDANMNYVCAAGTGSFVEEQAKKLGYKISEAGPAVLGLQPPFATDRCTVFMEQDMVKLIQSGASTEEAFAAVMVSVTKNYLNKVVGNRHRSREKIFFQGATARNPALVAAFEQLLNVEMVVSPYCHVMGSYGVALLTQEMMKEQGIQKSSFRGLNLEEKKITLSRETCHLCHNHCSISFAHIEGTEEKPSWGYMCGREPGENRMRATPQAKLLKRRQNLWLEAGEDIELPENAPVIGIPQALTTYSYLPLWRNFFHRLGYRIQLSGPTNALIRERGTQLAGADFCFPAKVILGHVASLASKEGVDYIFLPQMKNEEAEEHVSASTFCPYVQGSPAFTKAAFKLNGMDTSRILSPIVDMRLGFSRTAQKMAKVLSPVLSQSPKTIERAWKEALKVQRDFEKRCLEEGQRVIEEAQKSGEKLLILLGRPYNLYDQSLNLGLPEKLAEQGRTVVPLDMFPVDLSRLGDRYQNVYWRYGQKILSALEEISTNDSLDVVYFTNFGCGPDSFILSYASEVMGNKPFLAIELDEHGSDTGYMTRIEAFFDVLKKPRKEPTSRTPYLLFQEDLRNRILWIPNMHPFTTELFSAALRRNGYDARALPLENEKSFEIGRSVTRGSECFPTALTIGSLLMALRADGGKHKHAFFMPTAQGPCRFGQYISLQRQILDKEGFTDVPILAPSHHGAFGGLDETLRRTMWKAVVVGDLLLKSGCKIRPYEIQKGSTNQILEEELQHLSSIVEQGGDIVKGVQTSVRRLFANPINKTLPKPIVGIVGEIYVRNNVFANENVIGSIEKFGAEAWMTPLSEWILFTSSMANIFDQDAFRFSKHTVKAFLKYRWLLYWEKKLYEAVSPHLDNRHEPTIEKILKEGRKTLPENVGAEAILIIGRTVEFAKAKASLVVNVSPFSCMPGTVTTALLRQLSVELGMPVVNLFYDGTRAQNRRLEVFLSTALQAQKETKIKSEEESKKPSSHRRIEPEPPTSLYSQP